MIHPCAQRFAATVALFVLCLSVAQGQGTSTQVKPVALVNGEPISMADLKAVLNARPQTVPLTESQRREIRSAALDLLVDDLLIRQFLRQHAPPVAPADLDKAWNDLKDDLSKSNKTIADLMRDSHQTEEQVKSDLTVRLQWKSYLAVKLPEAELKTYYQANKFFFDKTFVQASHILVKAGLDPAERQKAREKLEYLHQQILAGKISFEDAAEQYSDCPSKKKKGDLGPFPYKFVVVEPIAKAAFSMKENEISGVIATDYGVHILKVTKIIPGQPSNFETIRETVREVLAQDLELYQKVLADQRKAAKIEICP